MEFLKFLAMAFLIMLFALFLDGSLGELVANLFA